jgi:membrane protein
MGLGIVTMSHVVSVSRGLAQAWPQGLNLAFALLEGSLLVLGVGALFKYLPNVHVRWAHAMAGGVWVSLALEAARRILTWYLSAMPAYSKVYGALATFPILLIWIYIAWMIVLSGAVVVSLLPGVLLRRVRVAQGPGWELTMALEVLHLLERTKIDNRIGCSLPELAEWLRFNPTELETVLRCLVDLGWVARLEDQDRWVLLIQTHSTPLAPLLQAFMLTPTQSTRAIWQPLEHMSLADALLAQH